MNFHSLFLSVSNISFGKRQLEDKRNLSTSRGQISTGPTTGITTGQVNTPPNAKKRPFGAGHRALGAAELVGRACLAKAKSGRLRCYFDVLTPRRVADGGFLNEGTSLDATSPHSSGEKCRGASPAVLSQAQRESGQILRRNTGAQQGENRLTNFRTARVSL